MGWCSGSYLADDVWHIVKDYIPEDKQQELAKRIIKLFKSEDPDCWDSDLDIVIKAELYS